MELQLLTETTVDSRAVAGCADGKATIHKTTFVLLSFFNLSLVLKRYKGVCVCVCSPVCLPDTINLAKDHRWNFHTPQG